MTVSIREIARQAHVDPAVARRAVVESRFPPRDPEAAERLRNVLANPITPAEPASRQARLHAVQTAKETPRQGGCPAGDAAPVATITTETEDSMLIPKQTLTQDAIAYWGIRPDAFDLPYEPSRVFLGQSLRVAYEHMLATAHYGGLMAIIGESGAGKTTLKDLLITELAAKGDVVVIAPQTAAMERDDTRGKTLKVSHINEAIMAELAPGQPLRRTMQGQLSQVAATLAESGKERPERRHLLIFEEAHCLPKPSLRHLKRFLELRDPAKKGLSKPLLSILLLGQPELADTLSPADPDAREIWQRCQVVRLSPLDRDLPAYVAHRLGGPAAAFTAEALTTLAAFMRDKQGRSALYPLAVDSWLIQCLNVNAGLGEKREINAAKVLAAKKRMDAKRLADRTGGQP